MKVIIIVSIVVVGLALRTIGLGSVPPHLGNDEISIAYDAYSLLHTSRDEHNNLLPLSFESHGTYKAPLTIYLTVPSVWIFGNSEFSARLPSAILGTLTVVLIGILAFTLSRNINFSLLISAIMAITPWHIFTSRHIYEGNIGLLFVVLGVCLFYRNKMLLSSLMFALSIYAYHTQWGFTPMLLLGLGLLHFKKLIFKPRSYIATASFLILIFPIFLNFLRNLGTHARANTEFFLNEPHLNSFLEQSTSVLQNIQVILHAFLGNYSSYTNFNYLFFDGLRLLPDTDPFQVGLFFAIFIPAFLVGIFTLQKYLGQNAKIIYIWAAIGPIVPALTIGGPGIIRNLVTLIPYIFFITAGSVSLWQIIGKRKFLKLITVTLVSFSFIYFLAIFYYHFPQESQENYQYGFKQIATYINANYDRHPVITIDPKFGPVGQYDGVPHLYISYFTKLDPALLIARQDLESGLYFDKYIVKRIIWYDQSIQPGHLYTVPSENSPSSQFSNRLKLVQEIFMTRNRSAFKIYEGI